MSRLILPVPSLIGGVSTQPEATRLPQQAELSSNCIGTIVEGLKRRPPAEHQHVFPILAAGVQHDINLLEGSYLVSTDGTTDFRVFDVETGTPQVVVNRNGQLITPAGLSYLNTPNPREDLRFLSLSDYTLILNRQVTVATTGVSPARLSQALVRVTQGSYRTRYVLGVRFGGNVVCEVFVETLSSSGESPGGVVMTPEFAELSVRTDVIAKELASQLNRGVALTALNASYSGVTSGGPLLVTGLWNIDTSGSVIRIQRIDGQQFDVYIDEAISQGSMVVINQEVQLFSELPSNAPNGMVVEVIGDPKESEASYWAKFVAHDSSVLVSEWAEGYWEETVAPEIVLGLDPATMPHALIRQTNGQWRLTQLDGIPYLLQGAPPTSFNLPGWEQRQAGDDITNPHPDFVGKKLRGLCFHEGRLGLLSEDSFVLSEVREPFNLYRTTVIDVIDSERIIIKAPSKRAETLHHCVPMNGDIVLFSEETQYLVRSEGPFSPSSVSLIAAGRHDADPTAEPIPVGAMLFVPRAIGIRGAMSALQAVGDSRPTLDSVDVTANVPGYLDVPHRVITTPQLRLVAAYGEGKNSLFVYTDFYNGNEKVHQSWQEWTFPASDSILHAWFRETDLFILAQIGTEEHLWKLRCEPEVTDDGNPITYLDSRISSDFLDMGEVATSSTRPGYATTTYTLPYAHAGIEARFEGTRKAVRIKSISGREVVVEGDTTLDSIFFGIPFESRHDLSRVVMTDRQRAPISQSILRLDQGYAYYDESGAFDVVIMDNFGGEDTFGFAGPYLGLGANYQKVALSSGKFVFPIRGRSEDVRISFRTSGTEGMRLVSLDITARTNRTGERRRVQ